MSDQIKIPHEAFFRPDQSVRARFRPLLRTAQKRGVGVSMRFEAAAVIVTAAPATTPQVCRIEGAWGLPDLVPDPGLRVGSGLCLPVLCRVSGLDLPCREIHAMPHDYRSLADFFARNLFLALARHAPVRWDCAGGAADLPAAVRQAGEDFRRQYFFVLKAAFPEPVFARRTTADVIELMMLSAYVPALSFDNALLQDGLEGLGGARSGPAAIGARVDAARAQMLAQYA